ncbi:IclR family transcriptional regulator domain-containing protein [Rhizobium sp. S152]|uniref:IclR family transcriptional regulator domain-containing protein n=1 Tax=Rhizobium sp. S152 TaxID=3055038 RepID=UPI003FA77A0F
MNSDEFAKLSFPADFNPRSKILDVTIDDTDEGGLFGFRSDRRVPSQRRFDTTSCSTRLENGWSNTSLDFRGTAGLRTCSAFSSGVGKRSRVRNQGFAWVESELDPAICGLSVPVRDASRNIVAAIRVNMIAGSMSEADALQRMLLPLRRAAEEIRARSPS